MLLDARDLNHIIQHAKLDLLTLKNKHIFVTGGTGFIGRWLLESLCYANDVLDLGVAVTVLSRKPNDFISQFPHLGRNTAISFIEGDIRSFDFPIGDFSHVIHAATDVIAINNPLEIFDVTIEGTRHILDFCQKYQVKDILLLSSGAVYGRIPWSVDRVTEEYSGCPGTDSVKSAYGIGKICTEWLGTAYSESGHLSCKYACIFAQVGPYLALDKQFAAGNFINNIINGEDILIRGDGTPLRSYMYAADLVVWLLGILVRGRSCRAYNVGSDHAISIFDLASMIAQISGKTSVKIEVLGKALPESKPERYVPDISRANKELSLKINIPLETSLKRTIEWFRK